MDREIEYLIQKVMNESRFRRTRSNGMFLSDEEIEVLERNNIRWYQLINYYDLLLEIERKIIDDYDNDLDNISYMIQEQIYYRYTHK